jgi:hypothetical protein
MSKYKSQGPNPNKPSYTNFFSSMKKSSNTGGKKDELPSQFIATVDAMSTSRDIGGFTGVDSLMVKPLLGGPDGSNVGIGESLQVRPLSPYFRAVPLPGEYVLVIKGPEKQYYYSNIFNSRGQLGENISQKRASVLPDKSDFFFGLFAKPRQTRKMDPTEGDIILEGRAGQTIRFTSTSEEGFLGKLFGGKSENKPVMMITCNNDEEEGLGSEDIIEDDCSIYLASEAPISTLQLESPTHKDYEKINEYADGQIIMRSNRLVLSSKKDNIIMSSADKIGLSTKKWVVDFDELMDVVENIQKELDQLVKGSATFTTGVGPTGPASNAGLVAKIGSAIKKLKA